jgi:tRNA (cmo5U34)-methyltransferase
VTQFHFDPATYMGLMRDEVPAYDLLQAAVAQATAGLDVSSVLDLGAGTGETLAGVLAVHPAARAVAVDKSEGMLGVARARFPAAVAELCLAELTDPLPAGPFDLVVSALAVHHLAGPDKADLFARIGASLRSGGRFVLGDVVVPLDPADAVTPLTDGHDRPSLLADQLDWLAAAGFVATEVWRERDLVVVRADRP